jgi:hypothetical protein
MQVVGQFLSLLKVPDGNKSVINLFVKYSGFREFRFQQAVAVKIKH